MSNPILNWVIVVSLLLLVFLFKAISNFRTKARQNNVRFLEMGSEEEMFFIPGDKKLK